MIERLTIDSNILIYAFDPTDSEKHHVSMKIVVAMTAARSILPMQCLAEFYSVTTRKKFLTVDAATSIVLSFITTLIVTPADLADMEDAMSLQKMHGLQTFDSLLLATGARSGCTLFLSEDMQDHRTYGRIEVINPFRLPQDQLDAILI